MNMRYFYLLMIIFSISLIGCSKSRNGKTSPVILLNNKSIDSSLYFQSLANHQIFRQLFFVELTLIIIFK